MNPPTPAPAGEGASVPPDWAVKAAQTLREAINAAASDDYIANMIVGLVAARTDEADDWRVKYEAAHKLATEQCLKLAQEKDRADNAEKWAEARLAEMKATNDNWAKQVAAMAHPPQPPASEEVANLRVEVATLRKQLEPIQSPESWAAVVGELDSIKQHVIPNYVAQLAAEQEARAKADLRADVLQAEVNRWKKWREEQPWLSELRGYETHVTALTTRLQAAEADRDALRADSERVALRDRCLNIEKETFETMKQEALRQNLSILRNHAMEIDRNAQAENLLKAQLATAEAKAALAGKLADVIRNRGVFAYMSKHLTFLQDEYRKAKDKGLPNPWPGADEATLADINALTLALAAYDAAQTATAGAATRGGEMILGTRCKNTH